MMDATQPPSNPYSGPPPVIPPQPPTRPTRTGTGWKIAVVILVVMLGFSMLMNLGSLFGNLIQSSGNVRHSHAGPRMEEVILEENDSPHKIAVIPVEGIIMSRSLGGGLDLVDHIQNQLDRAADDSRVKAVILQVNSPGGEVLASDDISRAIREFQDKSGKPVIASMGSLAASGGYYISAPCRWIVANELTITGSIGVIMQSYNYRGLMDKVGLQPVVFKSGKFKDMLSGEKPLSDISEEERAMVQNMVNQTFEKFKQVVAQGRERSQKENQNNATDKGRPLVSEWADYADGRILSGEDAFQHGFVDELGTFKTAVRRAEVLAHIEGEGATLVQYQPVFDLSNLFRMFSQTEGKSVKLDLGLDTPRLEAGHLYFLSPTFLH